jgi:hypothetical protein
MSYIIDLDSSIFSAPKSGQCLLLEASATLLLPKEHTVLLMNLEQILNSRSLWITKGQELALHVCIEGSSDGLCPMFMILNDSIHILSKAKVCYPNFPNYYAC